MALNRRRDVFTDEATTAAKPKPVVLFRLANR